MIQNQLLIPRDIKNKVIHGVCNMFPTKTSEIIAQLASVYRKKARSELRVPSKQAKDIFFVSEDKIDFSEDHKQVRKEVNQIKMEDRMLMLAVSQNRTQKHWGHRHLCV